MVVVVVVVVVVMGSGRCSAGINRLAEDDDFCRIDGEADAAAGGNCADVLLLLKPTVSKSVSPGA